MLESVLVATDHPSPSEKRNGMEVHVTDDILGLIGPEVEEHIANLLNNLNHEESSGIETQLYGKMLHLSVRTEIGSKIYLMISCEGYDPRIILIAFRDENGQITDLRKPQPTGSPNRLNRHVCLPPSKQTAVHKAFEAEA